MKVPGSIIIVGSGEFGLSTALALTTRPTFSNTKITVLDRLPFPASDGSSIDSSRIVRPDYSDPDYARLCHHAQRIWRGDVPSDPLHGIGSENRYTEQGLVLTAEAGSGEYVEKSFSTVGRVLKEVGARCELELLKDETGIMRACKGITQKARGIQPFGQRGYVNWTSGWANAEDAVRFVRKRVEETGRVRFEEAAVVGLIEEGGKVVGVKLKDGGERRADLVVLATGAWTPGLVNLEGRTVATGQALAYLKLTEEEYQEIKDMPVVVRTDETGIFFIVQYDRVLKIARHAAGYLHLDSDGISRPRTAVTHPGLEIPEESRKELHEAVKKFLPQIPHREFEKTRLCWYNDTATGDFIVDYHPEKKGLFLATGGSGHGFKFLPIIGRHIVDILEGVEGAEYKAKWKWPQQRELVVTKDGSRGGQGVHVYLTKDGKEDREEKGAGFTAKL
ncbi:fructosyl amino acid oxidasesarcosine oxidase [Pyronema omphalodes]|nr:fructosyl amino acid oxidasesarcosine oxidase [Pyronema omphalodes]